MMTLACAEAPQGRSSCPRWRQKLANARSAPSSPRTMSTLPSPAGSARMSPVAGVWELRPTHSQPPPKKYCCSQANTSAAT